jgi:Cu/Ag efflux pump CusA
MVVALTLTPALSMLLLSKTPGARRESAPARRVSQAYSGLLSRTFRVPRKALFAVCAAGLLALAVLPLLGEPHAPSFKDRNLLVQWRGAPGTSLPEMARITTRTTQELRALPGVLDAGADVGRAVTGDRIVGTNSAEIWVSMKGNADYDRTLASIRTVVRGTPGIDGDVRTYETDRSTGVLARPGNAVTVRLYGQDYGLLGRKGNEVKALMSQIRGVHEPQVQLPTVQPTMQVEVNLAAALRNGLKPGDVRRAAGTLLAGLTVGDFFEQQKVFEVVVNGTTPMAPSIDAVRNLQIDTPSGGQVSLGSVAGVHIRPNPVDIRHDSISRYVDVRASVQGRDPAAVRQDVQHSLRSVSFPLEYHAEVTGGSVDHTSHSRFVSFVVAAAIGILLLLQAAFRSWSLAFLVLSILPLAVGGGLVVAFLTGSQQSLGAYAGILAVFAIAARHGILLVTRIEQLAKDENAVRSAGLVKRAAGERLVPTLASIVATGMALVPFVFLGDVAGNEITHEIAAVILGGLLSSTLLILVVLPAAYVHVAAARARRRASVRAAVPALSALLLLAVVLSGCSDSPSQAKEVAPVKVERQGDATRIVLSSKAAQRLGVQTGTVRDAGGGKRVIPYAAVLYEPDGKAITYTSPAPLHYVRAPIVVDRITGGSALLAKGPPAGTRVVTVGADELLGAEQGVAGD